MKIKKVYRAIFLSFTLLLAVSPAWANDYWKHVINEQTRLVFGDESYKIDFSAHKDTIKYIEATPEEIEKSKNQELAYFIQARIRLTPLVTFTEMVLIAQKNLESFIDVYLIPVPEQMLDYKEVSEETRELMMNNIAKLIVKQTFGADFVVNEPIVRDPVRVPVFFSQKTNNNYLLFFDKEVEL